MRLVVVGTGLMGGSFALAARQCGLFGEVLGVEPAPERARRAQELGLVDAVVEAVPPDADAVLLASPSQTIAPWVVRLSEHPGIVFDTASVKSGILAQIRAACPLPPRFVPCHPLAGSEKSGPQAADETLYRGNAVVLTPEPETDAAAVDQVAGWWKRLGARVQFMAAQHHDEVLARTSHLPHLLAFAYLRSVNDEDLTHAAGGFRDFTRIGAADADMWSAIFTLNRSAVLAALDGAETELRLVRQLLETGDEPAVKAFITAAAERRRKFPNGG
jgi:cyclohexadieny/prephenate dehydrogenase / 3-phosphoshikimate 1-carboxyvinyltransferase